jgi:hypothetical protein
LADERNPMKKLPPAAAESGYEERDAGTPERIGRSQSATEPRQRLMQPPARTMLSGVVPVICNKHVLEMYESHDWQAMDTLKADIMDKQVWSGAGGLWSLTRYWARIYPTANREMKDIIASYFYITARSYANELGIDGDNDITQKIVDFSKQCVVDEQGERFLLEG